MSRRELLFIFNPAGVLVHEELLERGRGRVPRVGLGTAGPVAGPQEIVLDRGVPIRLATSVERVMLFPTVVAAMFAVGRLAAAGPAWRGLALQAKGGAEE